MRRDRPGRCRRLPRRGFGGLSGGENRNHRRIGGPVGFRWSRRDSGWGRGWNRSHRRSCHPPPGHIGCNAWVILKCGQMLVRASNPNPWAVAGDPWGDPTLGGGNYPGCAEKVTLPCHGWNGEGWALDRRHRHAGFGRRRGVEAGDSLPRPPRFKGMRGDPGRSTEGRTPPPGERRGPARPGSLCDSALPEPHSTPIPGRRLRCGGPPPR